MAKELKRILAVALVAASVFFVISVPLCNLLAMTEEYLIADAFASATCTEVIDEVS